MSTAGGRDGGNEVGGPAAGPDAEEELPLEGATMPVAVGFFDSVRRLHSWFFDQSKHTRAFGRRAGSGGDRVEGNMTK